MTKANLQSIYELIDKKASLIFPRGTITDIKRVCKFDIKNYSILNPESRISPEGIVAGSFYLHGLISNNHTTQKKLAEIFGCSESRVKDGFKTLFRAFRDMFGYYIEKYMEEDYRKNLLR